MKRSIAVVAATAAAALAAPAAQAATLAVDPVQRCYRETQTVLLPGSGFTANAPVVFTRDGTLLPVDPPILADPAGGVSATLTLPGLISGQSRLAYLATDSLNPLNTAEVSMLVTATDVITTPREGRSNRLLTIRGRGFFGGNRVWAHVLRTGRGASASAARTLRIGKVKGACKRVKAKKRLFPANPASGEYTVQFDTFRRYRKRRAVKFTYDVTIAPLAAAAAMSWRKVD